MAGGPVSGDRTFLLVGGLDGALRVRFGGAPSGEAQRLVAHERIERDLRQWAMTGAGANYFTLVEMYGALGGVLPRPPALADRARMADDLVTAFARGRLVALEPPQLHF